MMTKTAIQVLVPVPKSSIARETIRRIEIEVGYSCYGIETDKKAEKL